MCSQSARFEHGLYLNPEKNRAWIPELVLRVGNQVVVKVEQQGFGAAGRALIGAYVCSGCLNERGTQRVLLAVHDTPMRVPSKLQPAHRPIICCGVSGSTAGRGAGQFADTEEVKTKPVDRGDTGCLVNVRSYRRHGSQQGSGAATEWTDTRSSPVLHLGKTTTRKQTFCLHAIHPV